MLMLGGTGNNRGAILGSFIVWALWSWSMYLIGKIVPASFQTRAPFIRYVIIGVMLTLIMVKWPRGIIGEEKQVSRF